MSWLGIDLPEQFSEAGANIMSGMIKGIKSMGSSIKNAVTGMGQNVMNWFRGKLGIHSPSRVFIGYGENVSEGAGIGIARGASATLKSVRAITAAVATAGVMAPLAVPAITVSTLPTQQVSDALVRPLLDSVAMQGVLAQIRTAFDSALARTHGIVADITTDLRIDARPPVSSAAQRTPITFGGDTIHINITVPHGADPQAIANAVRTELDRRDYARNARRRSAMTDYGA